MEKKWQLPNGIGELIMEAKLLSVTFMFDKDMYKSSGDNGWFRIRLTKDKSPLVWMKVDEEEVPIEVVVKSKRIFSTKF